MTLLRALNSLSYESCTSSTYLSSRITGLHSTKATLPRMQIIFLMKSAGSLEHQKLDYAESITALCTHQLPTDYFSKLEILGKWLWQFEKLDVLISGQRGSESPNTKDKILLVNGRSDHRRGTKRKDD
ncbi:uncharacterized protein LOC129876624 [Solanum dulcamara]|uniref:uncharacterized protein LOC129876624 n=1 Tax=Solanum dulcamara TaxID=45834 RepID=UPI002485BA7E|nr:uncharacterized protein LOC129876624 [Solanum dulcamara]